MEIFLALLLLTLVIFANNGDIFSIIVFNIIIFSIIIIDTSRAYK